MSGDFHARYGLTVNVANVLGIRAVILEEAEELDKAVQHFRRLHPNGMPELGGDPVSKDAAKGFTEVTERLLARGQAHIDGLFALGDELAAAARDYGHNEQAITTSFQPGRTGPPAGLGPIQHLPPALREIARSDPPRAAGSITEVLGGGHR